MGRIVKPHQGLRINWDSPESRGLVFACAPGLVNRHDLVSGNQGTLNPSANWDSFTNMGSALESTSNTTGGAYWTPDPRVYDITNQYTLIGWGKISSMGGDAFFIQVPYSDPSANPWIAVGLGRNGSTSQLRLFKGVASTLQLSASGISGVVVADDLLHMYAVTEDKGAVKFYKDGVFLDSQSINSGSANFVNQRAVVVQNRDEGGVTNGYTGEFGLGKIFNKVLSDEEIKGEFLNRWKFVSPRKRRVFFVPAVGGVTNPKGPLGHPLHGPLGGPI